MNHVSCLCLSLSICMCVIICLRPILLAVNKIDVLPNSTHPMGKLGKDALDKVGG